MTTDSPPGVPSPQPGYPTTEAWRLIPHEDHTGSDARAQPADADRRRDTDAGRAAAHQHRHAARPLDTDGGITGWGEAFGHRIFPATRAAIDTLLGPMCVGRDPSQILALNDDLQRVLHGVGRNGPVLYALSGIDIALWDLAGKAAGLPLYRLLGGGSRADLPAYASLLRYGAADAVAHYTAQALARGYRHIKLHEITVPEVKA